MLSRLPCLQPGRGPLAPAQSTDRQSAWVTALGARLVPRGAGTGFCGTAFAPIPRFTGEVTVVVFRKEQPGGCPLSSPCESGRSSPRRMERHYYPLLVIALVKVVP